MLEISALEKLTFPINILYAVQGVQILDFKSETTKKEHIFFEIKLHFFITEMYFSMKNELTTRNKIISINQ